jgi:hypothetical protein
MARFVEMIRVAHEIHALVEGEPQLIDFRPATAELLRNAERLAAGDLSIGPLRSRSVSRLQDRELAERITRVAQMPGPDDDDEPRVRRAVAQLLGNVVEAVLHAVFSSFPELLREPPDGEP